MYAIFRKAHKEGDYIQSMATMIRQMNCQKATPEMDVHTNADIHIQ